MTSNRWMRSAVTGATVAVVSSAVGALVAELLSAEAPVAAVAKRTIDNVPTGVREWAIDTFGTKDKLVLGIGIVVVLALLGTAVARFAERRRWLVPLAIAALAVIGGMATANADAAAVFAALASALAAYATFWLLLPLVHPRPAPRFSIDEQDPPAAEPMVVHRWDAPVDRRAFVTRAGALWAGSAVAAGVAGSIGRSESESVARARTTFPTIPAGSADAAGPVRAGAAVGEGAVPFVTPNPNFYRIDTAFVAPRVSLDDWRLRIGGFVDDPLELTYDELLDRHVVERYVTLCCVSNPVGGDLVGNARFLGVPLAELLEEAGVQRKGTWVGMTSVDGWTCRFPTELALDGRDAMVAVGMGGEPLPVDHGFPARVVVPGLYGYVSATKWVERIDLVDESFEAYWTPRGWAPEGPVKTQSRIDVPADGSRVPAGSVAVAGIAFAQHRGIDKVEVRIDDGPWQEADLGTEQSIDTWRQWVLRWDATPGEHEISVRATDREGDTQPSERTPVAPDGATGHHTISVRVSD